MASLETKVAFKPDLLAFQLFGDSALFYNEDEPSNEGEFFVAGQAQGPIRPLISAYGEDFSYKTGEGGDVPVDGVIDNLEIGAFVGPQYQYGFRILGVELSAEEFADVVGSAGLADDRALVAKIFSGDDDLTGSSKQDVLDGLKGNDILEGGGGKDVFRFSQKAGGANADDILDFKVGTDVIQLSATVFTKVALDFDGLAKGTFVTGKKAGDRNDVIIYDKDSGDLFYDANGSQKGGQKLIATLDRDLDLSRGDFDLFGL